MKKASIINTDSTENELPCGRNLAEIIGCRLAENRQTLAVAESCTGGLIAKLITDIAGSSRYFTHGWVTYSNQAKMSELAVSSELIEKYGAVSAAVAEAMAVGAKKKAKSDFAVAVTGIAGPSGGTEQKPVGLVYISIAAGSGCETQKFTFAGKDRHFIRTKTAQTALNLLRLKLGV